MIYMKSKNMKLRIFWWIVLIASVEITCVASVLYIRISDPFFFIAAFLSFCFIGLHLMSYRKTFAVLARSKKFSRRSEDDSADSGFWSSLLNLRNHTSKEKR